MPRELACMTQHASREDPNLLESLIGTSSPPSGAGGCMAIDGLAALAARRFFGNR